MQYTLNLNIPHKPERLYNILFFRIKHVILVLNNKVSVIISNVVNILKYFELNFVSIIYRYQKTPQNVDPSNWRTSSTILEESLLACRSSCTANSIISEEQRIHQLIKSFCVIISIDVHCTSTMWIEQEKRKFMLTYLDWYVIAL